MDSLRKWGSVIALVLSVVAVYFSFTTRHPLVPSFGGIGVQLAENYDPYLRYNQGYNSALPIKTTGTLQGAATTITGLLTASAGELFSSTGTQVNRINFGSCAILAYATTISASTTATVDCSTTGLVGGTLTGVTSGDTVMAMATTSISSTYTGVSILSANASTTAGYLTLQLFNGTGTTFTWTATASSTIKYIVVN